MRLTIALLLVSSAALADQPYDIQLWRLGHPDDLGCTRCDGSSGDKGEPGTLSAQMRFHMLASTLGLAFVPQFQETAGTLGQSGFEIGFTSSQAFFHIPDEAWPTASGRAPGMLFLPTVVARKGLGGSFELNAAVSWLAQSQMMALSAELRWAVLDGLRSAPDVALRAFGTRAIGTRDLDLTVAGADAQVSKSFGVAGMMKLQPYGQLGVALVNAASQVVDFKPGVENAANPTADDAVFRDIGLLNNRYVRGAVGLRLVTGAVVLGLEGAVASGRNDVQDDGLPAEQCTSPACETPKQFVRVWSAAARLGFTF